MSEPDLPKSFDTIWPELARTLADLSPDAVGDTLTSDGVPHTASLVALSPLSGCVAGLGSSGPDAEVERVEVLGEGGHGVVHLATQRSLGRNVAVKSVRPDNESPGLTLELLREGWLMGQLEHPNIVPVYMLGLDEQDEPAIIMKRIEGTEWREIMRRPEDFEDLGLLEDRDRLSWHIRVLLQMSAHYSEPFDYEPYDVADELSAICNRAMHQDPALRFADAAALRQALSEYLRHRSSHALATDALEQLAHLRAVFAGGREDAGESERLQTYEAFSACRFGFELALRRWPDNVEARRGLQEALHFRVEFELAQEDPKAASLALAQIDEPPPELRAAVEALAARMQRQAGALEDLEALERAYNPLEGSRWRPTLLVLLGTLIAMPPLVKGLLILDGASASKPYENLVAISGVTVILVPVLVVFRARLLQNLINRRIWYLIVSVCGMVWVNNLGATILGRHSLETARSDMMIAATALLAAAILIDKGGQAVFAMLPYVAAYLLSSVWPDVTLILLAAADFLAFCVLAVIWAKARNLDAPQRAHSGNHAG